MISCSSIKRFFELFQSQPWKFRVLLVFLLLGIVIAACSTGNSPSFDFVSGDEDLVVLIRNQKDGNYRVRYEGPNSTDLRALKVMLGGQILHVDVGKVVVIIDGQEFELGADGTLPEGSQVTLNSGDEFDVRVTYHGRTLGGNYMYGFRINIGDENIEEEVDTIAEYEFVIVVE
jgi:hypothetical protein